MFFETNWDFFVENWMCSFLSLSLSRVPKTSNIQSLQRSAFMTFALPPPSPSLFLSLSLCPCVFSAYNFEKHSKHMVIIQKPFAHQNWAENRTVSLLNLVKPESQRWHIMLKLVILNTLSLLLLTHCAQSQLNGLSSFCPIFSVYLCKNNTLKVSELSALPSWEETKICFFTLIFIRWFSYQW